MKKNTAGQFAYFTIYDNNAEAYVTADLSAQCSATLLSDGASGAASGTFTQMSGRNFKYAFTQAETNYNQIKFIPECSGGSYRIDSQTFETLDIAAITSAVTAGILASVSADGISFSYALDLLAAMVNGKFAVDTPSAGNITFYKRDNVTALTVVNVNSTTRTRIS